MLQKWSQVLLIIISLMQIASNSWAETYHSPNGYSITAPYGWSLDKSGTMGSDVSMLAKPERKFANNLNVRLSATPPGYTLAKAQKEIKAAYQQKFPGFKLISENLTTVNREHAYELIFDYTQGAQVGQLWVRQDIILHAGKLYAITCTALAANADRYSYIFNRIIRSVRWTSK